MGALLDLARAAKTKAGGDQQENAGRRDPAAEDRRKRVLDMLAARPESQRAVYCDGVPVDGVVRIEVGIRYAGRIETCTVEVQAERYDGLLLLDLVQRHSGTVH